MKNLIRDEFDKIYMPADCEEEIRQTLEKSQPTQKKKHRSFYRIGIAVALIGCLLLSVAAISHQKGWLDDFLGNGANAENVQELQLSATDDEIETILEKMLVDGPFIYLQVSVRTHGNVNAAEAFEGTPSLPESGIMERLYTTFADGPISLPLSKTQQEKLNMQTVSSDGPTRLWRISRLDDESDPNFASFTMQIVLADLPANYEGLKLNLRLDQCRTWTALEDGSYTTDEEEVAIIEETIVLSDAAARITAMEDGRQVKVHTLGVQIQGIDFNVCYLEDEWESGVVLADGTRLQFKPGWTSQDYFSEEMQWHICLFNEVIDPDEVVAIYVGNSIYPLH